MAAYSRWDRLSGVWRGAITLSDGRGARTDLVDWSLCSRLWNPADDSGVPVAANLRQLCPRTAAHGLRLSAA